MWVFFLCNIENYKLHQLNIAYEFLACVLKNVGFIFLANFTYTKLNCENQIIEDSFFVFVNTKFEAYC